MKKLTATLAAITLALSLSAVGVKMVTASGTARHHSFTEGLYSYFYDGHRSFQSYGRTLCDEYHIQKLGGIGFGKRVRTGTHSC